MYLSSPYIDSQRICGALIAGITGVLRRFSGIALWRVRANTITHTSHFMDLLFNRYGSEEVVLEEWSMGRKEHVQSIN
ncbi:hypothetical protein ADUPG1_005780, partial [Aduncisulcus paluster]